MFQFDINCNLAAVNTSYDSWKAENRAKHTWKFNMH